MKILITGAGGMLGTDLVKALKNHHPISGAGRNPAPHLDIPFILRDLSVPGAALEILRKEKPEIVFHAAAMTNVDGCEQDKVQAQLQNHQMSAEIAKACRETGAFLIFFSTDYVFDGKKTGEYSESDAPAPLNIYGETKLAAENSIREIRPRYAVFRVSWLYGHHGKSFPRTILERAKEQTAFDIVDDQKGRPTFTRDLAAVFFKLLSQGSGILKKMDGQTFHLANSGTCSWAEFAGYLLKEAGFKNVAIKPISSERLNRPAQRPMNSVFSLEKARKILGVEMRPWQSAAGEFLKEFAAGGALK